MARAANMQALTNDIKSEHPGVVIYGIGDAAHKRRTSDHNEDDTPGSKAAQSDPDNRPEHRAIDVMLGPAMSRAQMYVIINRILNDPRLRARLWYINFENYKWSRSNGWIRSNNSNDPHPNLRLMLAHATYPYGRSSCHPWEACDQVRAHYPPYPEGLYSAPGLEPCLVVRCPWRTI